MSHDTLPLFRWQPPCKVLIFPLHKRVRKVRHTAAMLFERHGEDAELYWKQVAAANRKHFERIGLSDDQARAELEAFSQAVHAEMTRISMIHRDKGGAV